MLHPAYYITGSLSVVYAAIRIFVELPLNRTRGWRGAFKVMLNTLSTRQTILRRHSLMPSSA